MASRKRFAAFKGTGRQAVRIAATAEEQPPVAAAAAKTFRAPKVAREVTVDLAAVKPDDVFEGVVVRVRLS